MNRTRGWQGGGPTDHDKRPLIFGSVWSYRHFIPYISVRVARFFLDYDHRSDSVIHYLKIKPETIFVPYLRFYRRAVYNNTELYKRPGL